MGQKLGIAAKANESNKVKERRKDIVASRYFCSLDHRLIKS